MFSTTFVRRAPLLAALLALVALFAPPAAHAQACANVDLKPTRANLELVRAAVLCLHNAERARHGLPRLIENPRLRRAAARHTLHMVAAHFFDHTTPVGSTMVDRIRRTGYTSHTRGWSIGENIAWGTGRLATAAQINRSWMNSPGHRANILQRAFREIGIGIETGVPVRLSAAQTGATYTADFGVRR
ncbi:MAG: CAP domain-containing protein [Gemmatimonadales bacterium]